MITFVTWIKMITVTGILKSLGILKVVPCGHVKFDSFLDSFITLTDVPRLSPLACPTFGNLKLFDLWI